MQAQNLPHIICVIPFALPAVGKSFCYKKLQTKISQTEGCSFDIVSSDGIRGEQIKNLIERDKLTRDEAYSKTMKSGRQEYDRQLTRILRDATDKVAGAKDGAARYHFIFLDKNHPPDAISRTVEEIISGVGSGAGKCIVKKLYLIPKLHEAHRFGNYPFSVNLLAQAFNYGQQRSDHETLDNSKPGKTVEVQIQFLKFNMGVVFDQAFLDRNGLDGYLRVPMSVESFEVPLELKLAIEQLIK